MPYDIERRVVVGPVELRASADGKKKKLVGMAAVYGSRSGDLGGFIEVIHPGAFTRALKEGQDILARAEHDTRLLLGRRSSGTLRVEETSEGLAYEIDLPDTQAGRDVATLVERGDIKGSSFAFKIPDPQKGQRWSATEDGFPLRELLDLDLFDVAPTANPAYPETSVSARALEQAKEMRMDKEQKQAAEALFQRAFGRVLARATTEQRAQSFEDKMRAIYAALVAKLGSPWDQEDGNYWYVCETFEDSVIVERFEGARTLYQFPVMFGEDGVPTLGEGVEVEVNYVPVVAPGGERSQEMPLEAQQEIDRLRLGLA